MKVKVTTEFLDKYNHKVTFHVGDEVELDDERAKNVIGRGLAVAVDAPNTADAPDGASATDGGAEDGVTLECKVVETKKRGRKKTEE